MTKRTGPILLIAVFLCIAFASLLLAEGGSAPFHITSHDPPANEVGVALNANVQATFDDDVNAGTVTSATFVLHGHLGGLASGTFTYHAGTRTATLDPGRAFHAGEVLRVSATSGISSTGAAGLTPYGWQFTAGEVYSRCVSGFTDVGAGLTGVHYSSVAWGDYDNDGDLDILLTGWALGQVVSKVYRNDGTPASPAFTDIGAGLMGVHYSSVAWGDYDNDGDLDILLTGYDSFYMRVSKVYRNDAEVSGFTDIGAGLSGVSSSSVTWGDYDNDGDLDILLTGQDLGGNPVSKVYRNDAAGSGFTDIGAGLTGVLYSSVAWGDYDNDGDLDILLTGWSYGGLVSKVYRNDGPSGFTDIAAALAGVQYGSVAWGDAEGDGDLDILLTGESTAGPVSKVYRNDGAASGFTEIAAGLTDVTHSSVAWGDYDNDGDLDILLTGWSQGGLVSEVYRNDGPSGFADIGAGLAGVETGSVAWGDAEGDGDLDILLTGLDSGFNPVSKVYRNADCLQIIDHQPVMHEVGVPLTASVRATFDTDVNAGTVTSGTFVVHGHLGGLASGAFAYDGGTRTVTLDPDRAFHPGEVLRVSATSGISSIEAVPLKPYGWQFTAGPVVDRRFAGFADIGAALTGVFRSSAAWGDYDNDGDLDILLTGWTGSTAVSKVYRNDGASGFTDIGAALTAVRDSSVAWGDYDNDGDLDILLTGMDSSSNRVSKVYRNDGAGAFTDIGAALTPVIEGAVAWGDYDNDGDLDILLTGGTGSSPWRVSKVYRNDGPSGFADIGAALTGVSLSSVAWGDCDNDGDLDILLTGSGVSKVYRNDGGGAFSDTGAGLIGVSFSSVAWGDYDNDGDLDILLTGQSPVNPDPVPVSKLYRNDGPSGFTDIGAALTAVLRSAVAWGDYDDDGDLDVLLAGCTDDGCGGEVSKVYRNDGASGFTDIEAGLTGHQHISVAWGDYDNDGDLDILLTGDERSRVYRNKSAPELGAVTPSSGSGSVGATAYFTTTWSDADGWENLKQCYFHIGASPSLAGNVTLLYNAAKDKLWLLDDSGTIWQGGCYPGQGAVFWNSQAELDCSQTAVQGAGDTLSVRWAIEFKPGFEGAKKLGLKCKDRDKAKAKGKWKGTWTVE